MHNNFEEHLTISTIENINSKVKITVFESSTIKDSKTILLIIPLGYTKERFFSLCYLLAKNGFKVYSIEIQNNIGSDKNIYYADLNMQIDDIKSILQILKYDIILSWGILSIPAIKASDILKQSFKHIFVLPEFDVKSLIEKTIGKNDLLNSEKETITYFTYLGYQISATYIKSFIQSNLTDLQNVINGTSSMNKWKIRIIGDIAKENKDIFKKNGIEDVDYKSIPYLTANFDKNPIVAFQLFKTIVEESLQLVDICNSDLKTPLFKDIIKYKNNLNI
jgi:hypothetical protein